MDSDHPVFDRIEQEALDAARHVRDWFEPDRQSHPSQPQAPAQTPATMAPQRATSQEVPVSISSIADDIKNAIGNADEWVKQVTETHLPGLLAEAQKYESSPVVQALEKALLPPEAEQQIVGLINFLAGVIPAPAAPAEPAEPAQPVEAPAQ